MLSSHVLTHFKLVITSENTVGGVVCLFAGVAQLVEQLTCNQQVTSSSLVASSTQGDLQQSWDSAVDGRRAGSEAVKRIRL